MKKLFTVLMSAAAIAALTGAAEAADLSTIYSDHTVLTASGYTGGLVARFPVLVRISPLRIPGFSYERAGDTGENLTFTCGGEICPYSVEEWDTSGESLVWVRVPELERNTEIEMWWYPWPGAKTPTNHPAEVWNNYAAVWHMDETIDADGTTLSLDATGNGLHAVPEAGKPEVSNITRMQETGGVVGKGRTIESATLTTKAFGNHLKVDGAKLDAMRLGGTFTFSAWVKVNNYNSWPIFASRKTNAQSGKGWAIEHRADNRRQLCIRGSENSMIAAADAFPQDPKTIDGYTHLVVAYNDKNLAVYADGQFVTNKTDLAVVTDNGLPLYIGGGYSMDGTQEYSICGSFDEVRLYRKNVTDDWVKAEYETIANAAFLTSEPANLSNPWSREPAISPSDWEVTSAPAAVVEITDGVLKDGTIIKPVFYYVNDPENKSEDISILNHVGDAIAEFVDPNGEATRVIELTIYEANPNTTYDIGGTISGRILLGNNDNNSLNPIYGQARWETDPTLATYWSHSDAISPLRTFPNLGTEITHVLYKNTVDGPEALWRLNGVWMGSLHATDEALPQYNYLPTAASSVPRTGPEATLDLTEATHFALRNVKNAAIYSPYYTDGVGTIYFDAVNAMRSDTGSKLVVEIATVNSKGEAATDANCEAEGDPFYYLTHGATGGVLVGEEILWKSVKPTVLKRKAGEEFAVDTTQTFEGNAIKLGITSGGGDQAFYRIVVNLNTREGVRFRIRRVGTSGGALGLNQILVDNIIAAPMTTKVSFSAPGAYDSKITGKNELGFQCAFSTPYPSCTETNLFGRAKIDFSPAVEGNYDKYLERAQLKWRWRYLNQQIAPAPESGREWYTEELDLTSIKDGIISTKKPLALNGVAGDIEWYYDVVAKAPAYQYVDYTGLGLTVGSAAKSERKLEAHAEVAAGDRFASGGTDWFLRLREGASNWQRMAVVIKGSDEGTEKFRGTYDMQLVEDNLWRAFVAVPTNATGQCTFTFRGYNEQVVGASEVAKNELEFGAAVPGQEERNGSLVELGEPILYTIDNGAGYVEFKMSDRFLSYQVGRAEYQDFNYWNDAHTTTGEFKIDSTDTNSVDVAAMKLEVAPMDDWRRFEPIADRVTETFLLNDYNTKGEFEKEIFRDSHATPNTAWTGYNLTFVSERFVANTAAAQSNDSGMAGKLYGSGKGHMDFSSSDTPNGVEKVTLKARLGESMTFDSFAWNPAAFMKENYTFVCPATMSRRTPENGNSAGDMAVGASTSIVGYYRPMEGCYELRVERLFSGATTRLALYKWTFSGQTSEVKCLCYQDFNGAKFWTDIDAETQEPQNRFYGLMINLVTETVDGRTQTRIVAGTTQAPVAAGASDINVKFSGAYGGLEYVDTDSPHTCGAYGIGAKDCHAEFVMPFHYDTVVFPQSTIGGNTTYGSGKYFNPSRNPIDWPGDYVSDAEDLGNRRWVVVKDRLEPYSFPGVKGLMVSTNVTQKLDLYLKPRGKGESAWEKVDTIDVSSYEFTELAFTNVMRKGQFDIRLRTGASKAIDVVVDDIRAYKWQGEDIPDGASSENTFHYTQAYIETNKTANVNFARLQPARAVTTRPLAIRSPALRGLGKFTFSYDPETLNQNAEVWVQFATNNVSGLLYGPTGYNEALESDDWITIKKYKYTGSDNHLDDLSLGDTKTVYMGLHDNENRPIEGLYRLYIPQAVVVAAEIAATNVTRNVNYGSITITGVSCTDEPGASDRSWRAWNMRTLGDSTDSEWRMYLSDMKIAGGGSGLVAALNNSTLDVVDRENVPVPEDDERLVSEYPTIYTPTMKGDKDNNSGIGTVSFKARLYARPGETVHGGVGKVTVFGALNSTDDASEWKKIQTFDITSTVFSNYVWKAKSDEIADYKAVKFVVFDPSAKTGQAEVARVLLDELVVSERMVPTIGFAYARAFRNELTSVKPVADILSPAEQPLAGESWGVQAQLALRQLSDEIDQEKGFKVYLSYCRGRSPWGYRQWKDLIPENQKNIPLTLVDEKNLVFKTVGTTPDSLVPPGEAAGGEVVQYMLTVSYTDRHGSPGLAEMGTDWQQPEWYHPVDYNREESTLPKRVYDKNHFAAYTLLDTVSPGRAWINEISWNDGSPSSTDKQFIEVCIPTGVDMSGWQLRLTDCDTNSVTIATFGGENVPKSMQTERAVEGYEFCVLTSPETYEKKLIANASGRWRDCDMGAYFKSGKMDYSVPFQFELVRPTGVIEQQLVVDGTNTVAEYGWGYEYDGTNLFAKLDRANPSPKRFYAGRDLDFTAEHEYASIGVTTLADADMTDAANWPGGSNTWAEAMAFTPGAPNVGQTIPKDWFVRANGTSAYVYFKTLTDNISYSFDGGTSWQTGSALMLVPEGAKTNVLYRVESFYSGTVVERKDDGGVIKHATAFSGTKSLDELKFDKRFVSTFEASAELDERLVSNFGLGPDNRHTDEVMKWLHDKYGDGYSVDDIRLARFKGLNKLDKVGRLSLTEMYWLDIPPVPANDVEKATNDGDNWWLRYGNEYVGEHRVNLRDHQLNMSVFTNRQLIATVYASNDCTKVAWAPDHLQGKDVAFRIMGSVNMKNFLVFRQFDFGEGSFSGPDGDTSLRAANGKTLPPYSAIIDIMDPFKSPIGLNYGWDKYPSSSAFFTSNIDDTTFPISISTLKYDSTINDESQGD